MMERRTPKTVHATRAFHGVGETFRLYLCFMLLLFEDFQGRRLAGIEGQDSEQVLPGPSSFHVVVCQNAPFEKRARAMCLDRSEGFCSPHICFVFRPIWTFERRIVPKTLGQ